MAVSICAVLALAACRTGVPVAGTRDSLQNSSSVSGTITGTLSTEDGKSGVAGRKVIAVNLETGERYTATTSETGGYTLKVPPARYRMEIELAAGEMLVKDEGPFTVSRSELQHDVDFRIGVKRSGTFRIYQPPLPRRAPTA